MKKEEFMKIGHVFPKDKKGIYIGMPDKLLDPNKAFLRDMNISKKENAIIIGNLKEEE